MNLLSVHQVLYSNSSNYVPLRWHGQVYQQCFW